MKINYNWLQDYIVEKLPEPEALAEKIIFGAFEVEEIQRLPLVGGVAEGRGGINAETVLDIKVLPDRAHDCLSHYGMAREVAGLLGLTLRTPEYRSYESIESVIQVSLKSPVCRRYIARKIVGVTVGESPAWLKARLESIGQRSINNIVDATNYAMFSLGQPMHAFDADKLSSNTITVRPAAVDEPLTTLDGKILALDADTAVIADDRHALAIAGVKGGTMAEVDSTTKNIILEVANFDPTAVRKTAKKLGIQTDSVKRFENELTPALAGTAIHAITDLIVDLAGGVPEDAVDVYPQSVTEKTLIISADYINRILGSYITREEIQAILRRYGYMFEEEGELFKVVIPPTRIDIVEPHDMVEEIGRAYGYDKIQPELPILAFTPTRNVVVTQMNTVRAHLLAQGYSEVMTYAFRKKGDFEVARGAVGKSALRTNLTDGLKESYELNKQHAALLNLDQVKIFEIGTVFPKTGEEIRVGIADTKGVREASLADYLASENLTSDHDNTYTAPREGKTFRMWSEYPYMTRDVAVWIPEGDDAPTAPVIIKENGTDLLQGEPRLFDQFSKDGRTSYAYRMVFQSYERTLTDEEVNAIMDRIHAEFKAKGWEVR
jgi:phenylalanyl-tRNA synthetase beta chain